MQGKPKDRGKIRRGYDADVREYEAIISITPCNVNGCNLKIPDQLCTRRRFPKSFDRTRHCA
jgi:hypothetical protein